MISFLWNLLSALPLVSALLVVATANNKRPVRVRQIAMPGVGVVYVIIALFVLYRFNDWVRSIIVWIAEILPFVTVPQGSGNFYLLQNVLVILIFALLKWVLRPLFILLFSPGRDLGQSLVARLYEYVREYDLWFIALRYGSLRTYFRVFYWVSIGLTVFYFALSETFASWPGFTTAAYPALATLVIGEFYFAIDGLTKDEYDRDILGERDSARRVANFGPLRRILRETFPDRVLSDGIHLTSSAALDSGFRVGQLSRAEDHAERLAGAYFDRLSQARKDVDVNLVETSVQLLRGSSVLINNPFYVDLTPYLALPAYINLLKYQKVLIISGRDSLAEDLVAWMSDGLEAITGVPDLWQVELLGALQRDGVDVGILRFADVHNLDLLRANDEFLENVGFVILAEPARMMATGQLGLSLVLNRCSRGFAPAFAAFDGNHDGLVDALSHLLKVSLTEVVASALPRGASSEVIWEAEGPPLSSAIMPELSRYLGLGTEIGAVALKYQVKQVQWVSSDSFPVKDMMWIAGQYYAQINSFADLDLSQGALKESLVAEANPWAIEQRENSFLIAEDEIANVYETVRRFATRATNMGFVNVISQDYLLRDYMVANRDLFTADPKAVPAIVADFARTERNAVLRLIMTLVTFGVSVNELAREFELIGLPIATSVDPDTRATYGAEAPLVATLRHTITKHTGVNEVIIQRRKRHDPRFGSFDVDAVPVYEVTLTPALQRAIAELRSAYFFVEDEVEDVNRIGSLLYGHVYQALLPGQFVTHGGKYYEVQSISDATNNNGVVLRRAADHIRDRRVYRQLRRYALSDVHQSETAAARMSISGMEMVRCLATIAAESRGYLELARRSAIGTGRKVEIDGLPKRHYANKAVLAVRFPGITDSVRKTITLLLNELFVTVFPHSHHYVTAVTADPERAFGDLLPDFDLDDVSMFIPGGPDNLILIVEDSMVDLGLIVAVERHWERFLEIITDYLAWNASAPPSVPAGPSRQFVPDFPERPQLPAKRSWWRRLLDRLRRRSPRSTEPVEESESTATPDPEVVEASAESGLPSEPDSPLVSVGAADAMARAASQVADDQTVGGDRDGAK